MSRRNLVIAAVLAALAAVAALVLLSPGSPEEPAAASDEASAGVATTGTASPRPSPAPTGAQEAGEQSGGVAAPAEARPPAPEARAAAPSAVPAAPTPGAGSEGNGTAGSSGGTPSGAESKAVANKEDIRAAIKALSGDFKACYEQGLKSNPQLDGTVKVAFTLARSPDGGAYAKEGEIDDSTLGAPLVEACILSKIQTAKFKDLQGDGEVRVRYPFQLRTDQATGFGGQ